MLLSNRVAIVTGGARGIGRGIALRFAEEGCSIAIADVMAAEAGKTVEEISKKGRDGLFVRCDVSKAGQVQDMVNKVIDKFGKVDILVNNAGIGTPPKPIAEIPEEEWDRVLAINLKGVFLCCKTIMSHMKEKKYGKIINLSSAVIFRGASSQPMVHYAISKAGVVKFTVGLAVELAPFNINVNLIYPGLIDTDMIELMVPPGRKREDFLTELGETIPMKRLGTPQDIAGTALFLASDLSGYVTGTGVIVGGGVGI